MEGKVPRLYFALVNLACVAALSLADLQRVSKGLHSALWMQDKMLDQEELADAIVDLLSAFAGGEEQRAVFVRAMLDVLSREWPMMDRWRMDKFLMVLIPGGDSSSGPFSWRGNSCAGCSSGFGIAPGNRRRSISTSPYSPTRSSLRV